MSRKPSHVLAVITAVLVAVAGAVVDTAARAAVPGEVSVGGTHLTASVNYNNVVSTGGALALGVPFAHAASVSGDFSVVSDGSSSLRRGRIVAGYLIGCAVDISQGISVGINANAGAHAELTPGAAVTVDTAGVAALTVGTDATFGVAGEFGGEIHVYLAPGTVTAAVIAEAELDQESTFPFTFEHTNTALHVNGCLSQASAMPFITMRADSHGGIAQTTGYGDQFVF